MAKELDVADAKRHIITYDGDKIYVVISYDAKEIFISSVNDQIPKVAAIYDSLTRIISMAWQNNDIENVIEQLNKSSRSKFDLPGMLAELFNKNKDEK